MWQSVLICDYLWQSAAICDTLCKTYIFSRRDVSKMFKWTNRWTDKQFCSKINQQPNKKTYKHKIKQTDKRMDKTVDCSKQTNHEMWSIFNCKSLIIHVRALVIYPGKTGWISQRFQSTMSGSCISKEAHCSPVRMTSLIHRGKVPFYLLHGGKVIVNEVLILNFPWFFFVSVVLSGIIVEPFFIFQPLINDRGN